MAIAAHDDAHLPGAWLNGNLRLIRVPLFEDERGALVPIEFPHMPFVPARMFVIRDVPVGTVRGRHALAEQRQLLICFSGELEVMARWAGREEKVLLDRPDVGLLVEPGVWHGLEFTTENAVVAVLASGLYDPDGYVAEDSDRTA